jgi:hypothetical protein
MSPELVSLKNLDVLYTWSRDINAFEVKNIEKGGSVYWNNPNHTED